jgi:hypothetical protein
MKLAATINETEYPLGAVVEPDLNRLQTYRNVCIRALP